MDATIINFVKMLSMTCHYNSCIAKMDSNQINQEKHKNSNYLIPTSSTSNNSFEFGGISGGAPAEPYLYEGGKGAIIYNTSFLKGFEA
jgi:hypothetical protein